MDQTIAWAFFIIGFVLPLIHVSVSSGAGSWRPPSDSRCPFGPRTGWIVMIILLGPIGWFLFILSRRKNKD